MKTLLLSTFATVAWTAAALAEPTAPASARTIEPAQQAVTAAAPTKPTASQQAKARRFELGDSEMDTLKAGSGNYWSGWSPALKVGGTGRCSCHHGTDVLTCSAIPAGFV